MLCVDEWEVEWRGGGEGEDSNRNRGDNNQVAMKMNKSPVLGY